MLKDFIKRRFPILVRMRRSAKDLWARAQPATYVDKGGFQLKVPADHILAKHKRRNIQRSRGLFIEVLSSLIAKYDPERPIIDVGANVGDTAAQFRKHTSNLLIVVEPSSIYIEYLRINSQQLAPVKIIQGYVAADEAVRGTLYHSEGTAQFVHSASGEVARTYRLPEIAPYGASAVKIDTDGFDFEIIASAIGWFKTYKPVLIFECQPTTSSLCRRACETASQLVFSGYKSFFIFDDTGRFLVEVSDLSSLKQIVTYATSVSMSRRDGSDIGNWDIVAFHSESLVLREEFGRSLDRTIGISMSPDKTGTHSI